MTFLEREAQLQSLHDRLLLAASGRGQLVFLAAEAGGGKTTLVERFIETALRDIPTTRFSCDAVGMPGGFGPVLDVAAAMRLDVDGAGGSSRDVLFRAVLDALQRASNANVLVGEDAHWTDEASLDFVRFLGRRIGATRTLAIITFRDDGLDPYHPLRRLIGDLATEPNVSRLALPGLSLDAIRALADGTGIDPTALHARTSGNPFFVSEIIAAGGDDIPPSIRDAVFARASRLPEECRALLDVVAVIGSVADPDLIAAMIGAEVEEGIDRCIAAGMLVARSGGVGFRHELARDVFLREMSPARRRGMNRRLLAIVEADGRFGADLAHLTRYAEEANDGNAVLRYARELARHSSAHGAHRAAADAYASALNFASMLPDDELAALLEAKSYECYVVGRVDEAIADRERAAALRAASGDAMRAGGDRRWLSRFHWFAGHTQEAERQARAALALLETLPPGPELAMAYSNLSQLRMLATDDEEAIAWGQRAIDLATVGGIPDTLAHALTNVGTVRHNRGEAEGTAMLARAISLALEAGLHDDAVRAMTNRAFKWLEHRELDLAGPALAEAVAFAASHDLIPMELYLTALRSRLALFQGDLARACELAAGVSLHPSANPQARSVALGVCGLVAARRGQSPWAALDEALELASGMAETMRIAPVRAARAEAAWLERDLPRCAAEAGAALPVAIASGHPWWTGELAIWLHRVGRGVQPGISVAPPHRLELDGGLPTAAAAWQQLGLPFETARALALTGDAEALKEALARFDQLGASVDAARVLAELRAAGVRQIPRGPRPATRANPAQLTNRELEILRLVAEGRSNPAIADELFLSPRTVGHHVSAILGKLGIASRGEARERAAALGLLQDR